MLGKLIKNEFVNRGSQLLLILGGVLGLNVLNAIILEVTKGTTNVYVKFFVGLFEFIDVMAIIAGIAGIFFLTIKDFGDRLFKSQGYLTHTLPVKTSSILFARMVCDVVVMVAAVLVFPLAISISLRDFSLYKEMINMFIQLIEMTSGMTVAEKGLIVGIIIVSVIGAFLGGLASIWLFNAAYAIGHSFSKSKRAWSVIAYIVLTNIINLFAVVFVYIMDKSELDRKLSVWIYNNEIHGSLGIMFSFILIMDFIAVLMIAGLAAITNYTLKNRLNLE